MATETGELLTDVSNNDEAWTDVTARQWVGFAQGILMARENLTATAAFTELRTRAERGHQSIGAAATAIVHAEPKDLHGLSRFPSPD